MSGNGRQTSVFWGGRGACHLRIPGLVCCVLRMAKGALPFRPFIWPEVCDQIKQSGIAEVCITRSTRYDHDGDTDTRKGVTESCVAHGSSVASSNIHIKRPQTSEDYVSR
jgi:hypothetical protein